MENKFYVDFEFDGHGGPIISVALVGEYDSYYVITGHESADPWVKDNVMPFLESHQAAAVGCIEENFLGDAIRSFLNGYSEFTIVADSPVDIWRFCEIISTDSYGNWKSTDFDRITFEVVNVEYPTIGIKHNAYWDAFSLKEYLKNASS